MLRNKQIRIISILLNTTKVIVCSIRFNDFECLSLSTFIVFYSLLTRLSLTNKDLLTYLLTNSLTYLYKLEQMFAFNVLTTACAPIQSYKLYAKTCHVNVRHKFFCNRVVNVWSRLPASHFNTFIYFESFLTSQTVKASSHQDTNCFQLQYFVICTKRTAKCLLVHFYQGICIATPMSASSLGVVDNFYNLLRIS